MRDKPTRPRRRPFSGPTTALIWEQWRIFRPFLAGAVFMAAAGTAGLYINTLQHMIATADAQALSDGLRRLFSVLLPALFCITPGAGISFPAMMYRLPIATRRMVLYLSAMRLLFLIGTLLALLGVRMLFFGKPDWAAELRTSVLSAEALLAGIALAWALGPVKNWLAAVALMVVVVGAWFAFDISDVDSLREWMANTAYWLPFDALRDTALGVRLLLPGAVLLWGAAALWALLWGWAVFAGPVRARSGYIAARRPWQRAWYSTPTRLARIGARRRKPFASPFEAQVWHERRSRGYAGMLYPLVFAVALAYLLLKPFQLPFQLDMQTQFLPLSFAVLVAVTCFIVTAWCRLHEAYRVRGGGFRFFAAKPVSTQDMARARLHAMFRGAEAAVLFTLAVYAMLWLLPPMPIAFSPRIWPIWMADAYRTLNGVILSWVLVWVLLTWLTASLTAVSTPLALAAIVAYPLLRLGCVYAPVQAVMDNGGDEAVIALAGLCLMGHAVRQFFRAHRRGVLSPITVFLCFVAFALLARLLAEFLAHALEPRDSVHVFKYMACMLLVLGLFALAVAPVAALPLQFDRWRHGGK